MTTSITTQPFISWYPIIRDGITLDCKITWEAELHYKHWPEHHPYGMGTAREEMTEIEHINLVLVKSSHELTEDEYCQALKEGLKEVWVELD